MSEKDLQEYLSKEFQGEDSFLENIIFPIFDESNYQTAYRLPVLEGDDSLKALAARCGIQEVILYGTVSIGHIIIQIFEVTVQDHVQMSRNRVTIQQIIRRIMETYSSAFIIFHYEDNWQLDWRFSYCQKDAKDMTEAKRYTFLLGPNQSCRTAAQNFMKLMGKGSSIQREEIVAAFDVEALSDEFFAKYYGYYADFVEYITGKRIVKENGEWVEVKKRDPHPQIYEDFERNDKAVRDYIKRTLGRIVFLHFLQKKGWMGVEPNKKWGDGDLQFMQKLYECASEEQKDDFLDSVLEPLFDKALDTMPDNEQCLFDTKVRALPNGGVLRFPYLNGGLFERDAFDKIPTKFPRDMFEGFFKFLSEYNFTIDENDPDDAEVGVDPEMLGQIFENLLEDNKFKGAYYTKKEVVQYMAKEALIAYLQTDCEDLEKKERVRKFVTTYDSSDLNDEENTEIKKNLKRIKVCDPAIGSGAYPMGVLKEIFRCRLAIEDFSAERYADVKRHIIQNNIYGVDIEQGAVEIARLRFWLSLVVDEVEPVLLPNLDYKIVTGNSLITTFNGQYVNLEKNKNNTDDFFLQQMKNKLASKKNDLFMLSGDEKYKCMIEIKILILDMLVIQLTGENKGKRDSKMSVGNLFEENSAVAAVDDDKVAQLVSPEQQAMIEEVEALRALLTNVGIGLKERSQIIVPFFDWKLMFSEIFQNGGFDIVLGNPPYISAPNQLQDNVLNKQRDSIRKSGRYSTLNEKWDLYVPFMELGVQLLKDDGIFTMIVPYPLTNQKYGKKLRRFFCEENRLIEVVDAKGYKLFKNATVENCIPLIRKSNFTNSVIIAHYHDDKTISKDYSLDTEKLVLDSNTYVWNLTQEARNTNRYENMHVLGDYCYISKGMVLHSEEGLFTKDDLISKTKDSIHSREYVEAKDISRYAVERVKYLEYGTERCPSKLSRPTFPELYDRNKIIMNCLGGLNSTIGNSLLHNHSLYCAVLWKDLKGVENKSISNSIKKYSSMDREEMESLSNNVDLRYLLGIMNSSYTKVLLTNLRGGDYHIYPEHIRNIPIPIAPKEQQNSISELVDRILYEKKANPNADISPFDLQIDILIYHLYGLTFEEVLIADPQIPITKIEYDNYQ